MARRPVYLHIGLQKTGTTYLQSILFDSVEQLSAQGLDLVPDTKLGTFHLVLDACERYDEGVDDPAVARSLARVPASVRAASGSRVLFTQEDVAASPDHQIERLLGAYGRSDREIHLIVTVRDLARQIPSAWQQDLQAGMSFSFEDYLQGLLTREGPAGQAFWRNQDLLAILDRWGEHVPPERTHVVTVPPRGSDPDETLHRFCDVLGLDPAILERVQPTVNPSMGRAQGELLGRVNAQLQPWQKRRQIYGNVGKRYFAIKLLGQQPGPRALVPDSAEEFCRDYAARTVARLREGGYDVVGDLGDLEPRASAFGPVSPPTPVEEVNDAAVAAIVAMLGERTDRLARRREREREQWQETASPLVAPGPDSAWGRARDAVVRRLRRSSRPDVG